MDLEKGRQNPLFWSDGWATAEGDHIRDRVVFVLVRPALSENVGATVRALANMGCTHLRIVGMENFDLERAQALAVSAAPNLEAVTFYDSVAEAVADTVRVFAVTRRLRRHRYTSLAARAAAEEICSAVGTGTVALLFGCEAAGLSNDEMLLAQDLITIPTYGELASLNLAQAVMVIAYEIFLASSAVPEMVRDDQDPPATMKELSDLLVHMERALRTLGFVKPANEAILDDLRQIFNQPGQPSPRVRILRGIFTRIEKVMAEKEEST